MAMHATPIPRSASYQVAEKTWVIKTLPTHLSKVSGCANMAHVTPQREGATAAPTQQQPSRAIESPSERQVGTRALLLPVDDTDVS